MYTDTMIFSYVARYRSRTDAITYNDSTTGRRRPFLMTTTITLVSSLLQTHTHGRPSVAFDPRGRSTILLRNILQLGYKRSDILRTMLAMHPLVRRWLLRHA